MPKKEIGQNYTCKVKYIDDRGIMVALEDNTDCLCPINADGIMPLPKMTGIVTITNISEKKGTTILYGRFLLNEDDKRQCYEIREKRKFKNEKINKK